MARTILLESVVVRLRARRDDAEVAGPAFAFASARVLPGEAALQVVSARSGVRFRRGDVEGRSSSFRLRPTMAPRRTRTQQKRKAADLAPRAIRRGRRDRV